ncbi:SOUL family heme-binding protein [Roseospirillum parvum]|uniref:SOUL heme-binding protein n=1 Tax=Roseospirillum parvum TaxID=83401 RepID=A0A1G7WW91_9PROT|nr:heme-binding protein [Roseospirillum parvum]SDG75560.1 SOUL heme-binding protein [Roseospirillum parvum]
MLKALRAIVGIRTDTEQSAYTVIEHLGPGLEVRRYAPRLAAEARLDTPPGGGAKTRAFRLLFNYISGDNGPGTRVAMTTPVETAPGGGRDGTRIAMTVPAETQDHAGTVRMRFFLPAGFTVETAPPPRDPRIHIVELPEQTLAVLRYTGSTGPAAANARKAELADALATTPWRAEGPAVTCFYDPPWTLPFLRRNEVAVPVSR